MNLALAIATADGEFIAHYSSHGLARLDFPNPAKSPDRKDSTVVPLPAQVRRWHAATTQALRAILAGCAPDDLPPLDLSAGTEFQRRVWAALGQIAWGRTRSYAEVAAAIGQPKATRAVGGACGTNPIPVLIPCHRVLAAHHGLGGFSGGLDWKRKLLAREGNGIASAREHRHDGQDKTADERRLTQMKTKSFGKNLHTYL